MSYKNIKKCSKCNIECDQNFGSGYSFEVAKQRRIFTKNGKDFCFSCLVSEYNVNCRLCHKQINSKDELAYWGGVISVNGSYELDPNPDFFDFRCLDCGSKRFDTNRPMEDQINPKKCRIAGCSQESYYSYPHLCKQHSRPCQGTMSYGKKCNLAIGIDEGDFCKHCKNQTRNYQQQRDGSENKSKQSEQEFEKYKQFQAKAQSYWNSLSSAEREEELTRILQGIKAGKYWKTANAGEGSGWGWACDGSYWEIENGKYVSSRPHLVPVQITEEFMKKEIGSSNSKMVEYFGSQVVVKKDNNNDKNSPPPGLASQTITNSNGMPDNSADPENFPQLNPGKDKSPEAKSNVKTIRFENKENNGQNNSDKSNDDDKVQIIDLQSIKRVTLTAEGNLVIEFNSEKLENGSSISQNQQVITTEQINTNQELQKISNYCQRNGKSVLNQQEISSILAANSTATATKNPKEGNNTLLIGGIICAVLIAGTTTGLLLLKKRKIKKN